MKWTGEKGESGARRLAVKGEWCKAKLVIYSNLSWCKMLISRRPACLEVM